MKLMIFKKRKVLIMMIKELKVKNLCMVIFKMQITINKKFLILNKKNMIMVKKMKKMIVIMKMMRIKKIAIRLIPMKKIK